MLTVSQTELEIRLNEKQREVIDLLITQIRAEPAWQPGVILDASSQEIKDTAEATFETVRRAAERAKSGNAQFRQKADLIRLTEHSEETQAILKDLHEANVEMSAGLLAMKGYFLALLNGLLEARGQPPFELVLPNAN